MRVQRRPIAGGMPILAACSITLMVIGAVLVGLLGVHRWPFGLFLFLLGLWLGVHRHDRWQCRRCRTMYRDVVGDEPALDPDKTLRVET